jgi:chitinase
LTDEQAGYVACINRLRELFAEHKSVNPCSKDYIISGAPQCPLDEPYMSTAIAEAQFDVLWIQFYNNGANGCTARNYTDSLAAKKTSGFNYDSWVTKVNAGKSAGAKLYIGLLAGQAGSTGSPNDYINAAAVQTLVTQYHSHAQFGGVMLYEATVAENNGQFYNQIKAVLNSVAAAGTVTSSATICSSTTSSSSKISSTSTSTTSSKISSTTSSSSKVSSTSTSTTSSKISSTSSTSSK